MLEMRGTGLVEKWNNERGKEDLLSTVWKNRSIERQMDDDDDVVLGRWKVLRDGIRNGQMDFHVDAHFSFTRSFVKMGLPSTCCHETRMMEKNGRHCFDSVSFISNWVVASEAVRAGSWCLDLVEIAPLVESCIAMDVQVGGRPCCIPNKMTAPKKDGTCEMTLL